MTHFPAQEKLRILQRVLQRGEAVSAVCVSEGISRKTFYQWKKRYLGDDRHGKRVRLQRSELPRSDRFVGTSAFRKALLNNIVRHPKWSIRQYALALRDRGFPVSHMTVLRQLRRLRLDSTHAREEFASLHSLGRRVVDAYDRRHRWLLPEARKMMVEEVLVGRRPVSQVCRDYHVSRKTFYKWRDRYQQSTRQIAKDTVPAEALDDRHLRGYRHPLSVSEEMRQRILRLVTSEPSLSAHKLAARIEGISNHGVHNVLSREDLNTMEKRLKWAQLRQGFAGQAVRPITAWLGRLKQVFEQFLPGRAPAPPPAIARLLQALRAGPPGLPPIRRYTPLFFLLLVTFGLFSWGRFLGSAESPTQAIGFVFASLALSMGSVFFLYSLKYYFTLAVVLSFSRELGEGSETSLSSMGAQRSWWKRLFGLRMTGTVPVSEVSSSAGLRTSGLEPDLARVELERKPFISVHLPMYNESRVAERILKACTAFEYDRYEIIVADDSTDETQKIVQRFADSWNASRKANQPQIKVIHRDTREGFKGGALKEALKHTNSKAEFIVVFDADFVPYPDTLELFLKYFQVNAGTLRSSPRFKIQDLRFKNKKQDGGYQDSKIAAIQGYQWHVLNKSENWITRGVRSEYAGSYVIERSGEELYGGLKQIAGSVYMIRRDLLDRFGWGTSLTEDFELTLRLYAQGYKVVYTPYIQAPAECASTLRRLVRQRMRWAEGHSFNIKRMFLKLLKTSNLSLPEKLEFLYLSPYYLQAAFFLLGTISWLISETIFRARLPFWTAVWGWSLVFTNFLALPLMNTVGLFLEEAEERDYLGILAFTAMTYLLTPFQAYAAVKGFIEREEGPWFRTPKTGRITDIFTRGRFYRFIRGIFPGRAPALAKVPVIPLTGTVHSFAKATAGRPVSLLTANNQFNAFAIRPRKMRWVSKVVLAVLLAITVTTYSFARGVPEVLATDPSGPFYLDDNDSTVVSATATWQLLDNTEGGNNPNTQVDIARNGPTGRAIQYKPGVTNSATINNNTCSSLGYTSGNGAGWIFDTPFQSGGKIVTGDWTFYIYLTDGMVGLNAEGGIIICVWKVTTTSSQIDTGGALLVSIEDTTPNTNILNGGGNFSYTSSSESQKDFNADEYFYVEYWVYMTARPDLAASTNFHTNHPSATEAPRIVTPAWNIPETAIAFLALSPAIPFLVMWLKKRRVEVYA